MENLSDIAVIKKIMNKHGFAFSKSLGQNFLIDPEVCPEIARLAGDGSMGALEIGAGIGVLTNELAKKFKKVVTFEIDRRLIPVLGETLAEHDNIEIINEDFLKFDIKAKEKELFGGDYVVCANLPYYVTSPIIMKLLESRCGAKSVTVMVQKEAAERLCAEVGSRQAGAVTAAVNYYARAEILFEVGREAFMPSPKVDSCVIRMTPREAPPVTVNDEKFFFSFIKAAFAQRRKTAANTLSASLHIAKPTVLDALREAGLGENVRAESLDLETLAHLSNILEKYRQ